MRLAYILAAVAVAAVVLGCYGVATNFGKEYTPVEEAVVNWLGSMEFRETLHATTKGMKYWYEVRVGPKIGIPYEAMPCSKCHATCETCHGVKTAEGIVGLSLKKAKSKETCFACHGRQKLEYMMGTDAHMKALGVSCTFCHSEKDIHGYWKDVNYMYENGGIFDTSCEKCHLEGLATPPFLSVEEHRVHLRDIACVTCHAPAAVTCYNCHLSHMYETYVKTGKPEKKAIKITSWMLLARDAHTGKIVPASMMVIVWTLNKTVIHVDIAKYMPHLVTAKGKTCKDCHGAPAAKELYEKGVLRLVWVEDGKIKHQTGVIPIVEGTKLILQTFVWDKALKTFKPFKEVEVVVNKDLFVEDTLPLTKEDLEKLVTRGR